jgi:hypothetical protein
MAGTLVFAATMAGCETCSATAACTASNIAIDATILSRLFFIDKEPF